MAGMYPDNQTISLFGETVEWPGMGPDGKFTNGNFANPAELPSRIPAETVNLLVDNISELITKLGGTPDNTGILQLAGVFTAAAVARKAVARDEHGRAKVAAPEAGDDIARKAEVDAALDEAIEYVEAEKSAYFTKNELKDYLHPVGSGFLQYPWDKTPAERGFPGSWEDWSSRAVIYGLSDSPPPASTATRAAREAVQGLDFGSDLAVGDAVADGPYAGKYVTEVLSAAGCFFGVEGGFRPAFVSGGIQEDAIRNIRGHMQQYSGSNAHCSEFSNFNGALVQYTGTIWVDSSSSSYNGYGLGMDFNANAGSVSQNPMAGHADGQDIRPRNMSVKLWLRIN